MKAGNSENTFSYNDIHLLFLKTPQQTEKSLGCIEKGEWPWLRDCSSGEMGKPMDALLPLHYTSLSQTGIHEIPNLAPCYKQYYLKTPYRNSRQPTNVLKHRWTNYRCIWATGEFPLKLLKNLSETSACPTTR